MSLGQDRFRYGTTVEAVSPPEWTGVIDGSGVYGKNKILQAQAEAEAARARALAASMPWLQKEIIVGYPNWMLVAGAGVLAWLYLGRKKK